MQDPTNTCHISDFTVKYSAHVDIRLKFHTNVIIRISDFFVTIVNALRAKKNNHLHTSPQLSQTTTDFEDNILVGLGTKFARKREPNYSITPCFTC